MHDHPSVERLRVGDLRVFTPPPALYWTSADDADLISGSYKHGYGATEAIRTDPDLGLHSRYAKPVQVKKASMPSKKGTEDEDEDEYVDEDEDERNGYMNDDMDEENGVDGAVHNPKKRLKLGDRSSRKDEGKGDDSADHAMEDSNMSPERSMEGKDADSFEKSGDKVMEVGTEPKPKKKGRIVPKRGPRIGNEDGFNNLEDAKAAAERMTDESGACTVSRLRGVNGKAQVDYQFLRKRV